MNCLDFKMAIDHAVESRGPLELKATDHAAQCRACRKALKLHQQIDSAILDWKNLQPRAGFVDAVLDGVKQFAEIDCQKAPLLFEDEETVAATHSLSNDRRSNTDRRRSVMDSMGLAFSVAAACLLAMVFLSSQSSQRSAGRHWNDLSELIQTQTVEQSVDDNPINVAVAFSEVLNDLQNGYRNVAHETRSVAHDVVNAIPVPTAPSFFPDNEEIDLIPESEDVSRMWQPIGRRVESAFGFLLQAVPGEIPAG